MDERMFLAVNGFARATPWLHGVLRGYANYGVVLFTVLLAIGWWVARQRGSGMAAAVWAPLGMLLAVAVNQPIVAAVGERRPYAVLPHILVLATPSTDPSFPSDHATMAGAVAAGLFLVDRWLGAIAAVAAVLMGFARVYIAAHYPQDVLAGFAVGALVTVISYALLRRPLAALVVYCQRTRLRPLLTAHGGTGTVVSG
jgi:membrane-associated phospholipid phosphatase